jgi:hypothetical protein
MGLIINEEITLKNGMKITGAYLSMYRQRLRLYPGPAQIHAEIIQPRYILQGVYTLWVSQDAVKDPNVNFLEEGVLDFPITDEDLNKPVHQIAYDYIKTKIYTNTTDV